MEYAFLIASIVGFVDFTKAVYAKDFETATIIAGAACIGGVYGFFHIENLDITTGIQVGLAACGVYKGVQVLSGKYNQ